MSRVIKPENLAEALQEELTLYHESVNERLSDVFASACEKLVAKTKASAPVLSGDYRKHIASKPLNKGHGIMSFLWYVKAPFHRITHLLVKGHSTRNGGRTKADPFLSDALAEVLPECEENVKEVLSNG